MGLYGGLYGGLCHEALSYGLYGGLYYGSTMALYYGLYGGPIMVSTLWWPLWACGLPVFILWALLMALL